MSEFRMPSLGADMEAGTLVAWRKKPGDQLQRGDVIGEVETEKGVIEVEVYAPGILERYLVEPGTKVPVGTPLAIIREREAAAAAPASVGPTVRPAEALAPSPVRPAAAMDAQTAGETLASPSALPAALTSSHAPPSVRRRARELGVDLEALDHEQPHVPTRSEVEAQADGEKRVAAARPEPIARVRVSPAARHRAHQLGVDLTQLHGTGPEGAISLRDLATAEPRAEFPSPLSLTSPPASARRTERQAAMRRAIGAAMAHAKREVPHYYLRTTIDLGRALDWLADWNTAHPVTERMLPAVLLFKAVAVATRHMPEFNARYERGEALAQEHVHLGIAISLPRGGLVAPALHDADTVSLETMMQRLQDLVLRARAGTLRSGELSDGTITVTNLGERGVEDVFPIIYAPQTAIVGFGCIAQRPWVLSGTLAVRPVVHASLAADHRVTDGHRGARFLDLIDHLLQEPEKL